MNTFKNAKLLISPDPLINARRASLPLLSFDNVGQENTFEKLRKFSFSPFALSKVEKKLLNVPNVNVSSPISPTTSPLPLNDLLNLSDSNTNGSGCRRKSLSLHREHVAEEKYFNFARKGSSGAESPFTASSPDLWNKESSPWLRKHSQRQKSSPSFSQKICHFSEEILSKKRNSLEDSPLGRNQSCLHFPSLSPCLEDKPKQNLFPYGKSLQELNSESKELETERNPFNTSARRLSLHTAENSPKTDFTYYKQNLNTRRSSLGAFYKFSEPVNNLQDLEVGTSISGSKPFCVNSIIGRGGFGIVKLGVWKGEKVGIKIVKGKKAITSVKHETNSLKLGYHLNLVFTYAVVSPIDIVNAKMETFCFSRRILKESSIPMEKLQSVFGISDELNSQNLNPSNWCLVVSELCTSTNLLTVMNSNNIFDIDKLRILYQIASGLKFMHQAGYVHLDVKPSNCFLSSSGLFKLGDFGCTCKLNEIPHHPIGTVAYQAPEVLTGNPATEKCDIYSLGVTAWQMLSLETPFSGDHPHVIIYKVVQMNCRPSSQKPLESVVQDALLALVKMCWAKCPNERPSTSSFIQTIISLFLSFNGRAIS